MAMAGDEHNKAAPDDGTEQDRLTDLPEDMLADILRRVPQRWLAVSRCVCAARRDAIDSSHILRADLLPLSLAGLFIHFEQHKYPEYLARPSSTAGTCEFSGDLGFIPSPARPIRNAGFGPYRYAIIDHCNGLLLHTRNYVVNPAARWWNTLPTCPFKHHIKGVLYRQHLVYDPMLSPYYEVFEIPTLYAYSLKAEEVDPSMEGSEWPPSLCKMYVFSSKSDRWEEKDFVREGDAAGTVAKMRVSYVRFRAIYCREALYVQCGDNFLTRFSLSDNTYNVFKSPVDLKAESNYLKVCIARSEKGVYFLALYKCWIRVWILNESSGQMEWTLKHDKNLPRHRVDQRVHAPWILEDINYNQFRFFGTRDHNNKAPTGEIFEWNSDSETGVENKDMAEDCDSEDNTDYYGDIQILGFHPYKEVVFLSESVRTGLAYHLNVSKVEVIGNIYPKQYHYFPHLVNVREEFISFPYTPCWIEKF